MNDEQRYRGVEVRIALATGRHTESGRLGTTQQWWATVDLPAGWISVQDTFDAAGKWAGYLVVEFDESGIEVRCRVARWLSGRAEAVGGVVEHIVAEWAA